MKSPGASPPAASACIRARRRGTARVRAGSSRVRDADHRTARSDPAAGEAEHRPAADRGDEVRRQPTERAERRRDRHRLSHAALGPRRVPVDRRQQRHRRSVRRRRTHHAFRLRRAAVPLPRRLPPDRQRARQRREARARAAGVQLPLRLPELARRARAHRAWSAVLQLRRRRLLRTRQRVVRPIARSDRRRSEPLLPTARARAAHP